MTKKKGWSQISSTAPCMISACTNKTEHISYSRYDTTAYLLPPPGLKINTKSTNNPAPRPREKRHQEKKNERREFLFLFLRLWSRIGSKESLRNTYPPITQLVPQEWKRRVLYFEYGNGFKTIHPTPRERRASVTGHLQY